MTTFQIWMAAIRIKTLLIPTIQVLTSVILSYQFTFDRSWGISSWSIAFGAWFVAMLITIGTNLFNDVIDFEKGGDSLGHFGQLKVIRAGLLSKQTVKMAGILSFSLACLIPLLLPVPYVVCGLVFLSVICGYCYTGGPFPISYLGLSELFILIFYGFVCITTPFYLLTQEINFSSILLSLQMGMLAILPNALNNCRDIYEDAKIAKKTLAVRFGLNFARYEITFLTLFPFVLNLLWFFLGFPFVALLPLILLPLALLFVYKVTTISPGDIYNQFFALSVIIHFLFGLVWGLSWLF